MILTDTYCKPKKYIVEFTTQTNPKVVENVLEEVKKFIKERTGNMVGNIEIYVPRDEDIELTYNEEQ
jgi:hypothetical protein|tara:strand:- start:277 stop:477 length:201 start_codon:yes stop_codon:yes gene_type:complete